MDNPNLNTALLMSSSPAKSTNHSHQSQQQLSLLPSATPSHLKSLSNGVVIMDSTDYPTYVSDRRKSFRCRGSLWPTVASAPSVELEDYRTPRPSVDDIKNGKSFDLGGDGSNYLSASENNPLVRKLSRAYGSNGFWTLTSKLGVCLKSAQLLVTNKLVQRTLENHIVTQMNANATD
ncbi:unnamed protein product [Anisakis simplex]|uniref:Uncharacterized protein n=1 Tax=Anisakis simplex TaxID=6269 RepID=A0A0M3JYF7_ANISI|nr:unnamed protein product [Anisakis simplex]